jgi:hypothetical protein
MMPQSLSPYPLKIRGLLSLLFRRSHIGDYAPVVSLTRRQPEYSVILGKSPYPLKIRGCCLYYFAAVT